jgi:hypothetical protein
MDMADRNHIFVFVRAAALFIIIQVPLTAVIGILSKTMDISFKSWFSLSMVFNLTISILTAAVRLSHKEVAEYCSSFFMRAQLALPLISPLEPRKVDVLENKCGIRFECQGQGESELSDGAKSSENVLMEPSNCIQQRILSVNFVPAHQWYSNHMMVYLSIQANWLATSRGRRRAIRIFVWDDAYLKREEACKLLSMHKYLGIDACILKPRYYELMLDRWQSCPNVYGDKWLNWEDFFIWDPPRNLDDQPGNGQNWHDCYGYYRRDAAEERIAGRLVDVFWSLFSCLWLVSFQLSCEHDPNNMEGVLAFYRQHCEKDGKDILAMERFITGLCCEQLKAEIQNAQGQIKDNSKPYPQCVLKGRSQWNCCKCIPVLPREKCRKTKAKNANQSDDSNTATTNESK